MEKVYIQFETPKALQKGKSNSFWKRFSKKLLSFVVTRAIPVANPDYENKIDDVVYWLVEFDQKGIPEREIGLNAQSKAIMKMPFKRNYGYWTDNNLLLKDFKEHFNTSEISKEEFEKRWQSFGRP